MNSIAELQKFTRADLQGLKAEMERAQLKREIDSTVHKIYQTIHMNAQEGKTSCFKCCNLPENKEDRAYKFIMGVIEELQMIFPDVDIKHDSQTCIRTGKQINQGIYVDWS